MCRACSKAFDKTCDACGAGFRISRGLKTDEVFLEGGMLQALKTSKP